MYKSAVAIIDQKKATSINDFESKLSDEEWEHIFNTYTKSYRTYFIPLIRRRSIVRRQREQEISLLDHLTRFTENEEAESAGDGTITEWIEHVFCKQQNISIEELLASFVLVYDKTIHKRNTLCIIGKSNAGKSLIVNAILRPFSKAFITRSGDATQFHLQNLLNKTIGIFEEPKISPTTVDDFKLLLGGEEMEISVKNQDHELLPRIPIFITTNNVLTQWVGQQDATALDNRVIYIEFKKEINGQEISNPPDTVKHRHIKYLARKYKTQIKSWMETITKKIQSHQQSGVEEENHQQIIVENFLTKHAWAEAQAQLVEEAVEQQECMNTDSSNSAGHKV